MWQSYYDKFTEAVKKSDVLSSLCHRVLSQAKKKILTLKIFDKIAAILSKKRSRRCALSRAKRTSATPLRSENFRQKFLPSFSRTFLLKKVKKGTNCCNFVENFECQNFFFFAKAPYFLTAVSFTYSIRFDCGGCLCSHYINIKSKKKKE